MVGEGMKAAVLQLLMAAGLGLLSLAARADDGACTTQNLILGLRPQLELVRRDSRLVTDGQVALEGANWNDDNAVVLETSTSALTFDLGTPRTLSAAYLQADANDSYDLLASADGTPGSFKLIARFANVVDQGHGLRARAVTFDPQAVRVLKLSNARGDDFFSVSELAVYCKAPEPFPPKFRLAPGADGKPPHDALAERERTIALRDRGYELAALGLCDKRHGHMRSREPIWCAMRGSWRKCSRLDAIGNGSAAQQAFVTATPGRPQHRAYCQNLECSPTQGNA
jgi:hypothetical protein